LIVEIRRASRGMMISTIFASLRFASYRRAVAADAGGAGIGGGW